MNYLPHVLSVSKLEKSYYPMEQTVDNVGQLVFETRVNQDDLEETFGPDASLVWWEWRPK